MSIDYLDPVPLAPKVCDRLKDLGIIPGNASNIHLLAEPEVGPIALRVDLNVHVRDLPALEQILEEWARGLKAVR